MVKHIFINTFLIPHITILHQASYLYLQSIRIQLFIFKLIINRPPIYTFHLFAIFRKSCFHPVDYRTKLQPQFICIRIMLVFAHILLNPATTYPINSSFKVILTIARTIKIFICKIIGCTVRFTKMAFRIRNPRPTIHRITQLLVCQFLPGNINCFEPPQLLTICSRTNINHQFIIQKFFSLIRWQTVKIGKIIRKITINVLTNRKCTLLTINHLIRTIAFICPIHNIKRKLLIYGCNHRISFFIRINKFTLIWGAYIQSATISKNSIFGIILISVSQFTDCDFM